MSKPLRLLVLAFLPAIALSACASLPHTQAWRRIFVTGDYDPIVGTDTDASGFCYVLNATDYHTLHLMKIGPASNIAFNVTIPFIDPHTDGVRPLGVYVSPMISGKQYGYVVASTYDDPRSSEEMWSNTYDT